MSRIFTNFAPLFTVNQPSVDLVFTQGVYKEDGSPIAEIDVLSCSRASTGYAKTSSGTLTSFGNDTLRITDLGLLIEDARTNLLLQSQDFSTSWNFEQVTVSTNVTTAPDGTSTADKIVEDTNTNFHFIRQTITNSAVVYTYSIYIKAAERTTCSIHFFNQFDNQSIFVELNLSTGATSNFSGGSWTGASATVETWANGWYRVILSGTPAGTSGLQARLFLQSGSYTGDGSSGIYAWGAQIEQASFASSYIPTTTASATRAADAVTCTGSLDTILKGSAVSNLLNVKELVFAGGSRMLSESSTSSSMPTVSGSSPGNEKAELFDGGGDPGILSGAAASGAYTTGIEVSAGWNASGRSICCGAGTIGTDGTQMTPTGTIYVGQTGSGFFFYGYFRRLSVWNSRLSDATLKLLTSSFPMPVSDNSVVRWVSAVTAQGGTVSESRVSLLNALVSSLRADGVWSKLDRLWIFAAENSASALVDLVGRTVATAVNSPTFTTDRGYAGNGSTSYVNTNFNPSTQGVTYTQNDAHTSVWDNAATYTDGKSQVGAQDGSAASGIYLRRFSTSTEVTINDLTGATKARISDGTPHFIGVRTSSSSVTLYYNGVSQGSSGVDNSTAKPNVAFFVGGTNLSGSPDNPTTDQIASVSMGGALTATDAANLYSRLRTYMTAVGVS